MKIILFLGNKIGPKFSAKWEKTWTCFMLKTTFFLSKMDDDLKKNYSWCIVRPNWAKSTVWQPKEFWVWYTILKWSQEYWKYEESLAVIFFLWGIWITMWAEFCSEITYVGKPKQQSLSYLCFLLKCMHHKNRPCCRYGDSCSTNVASFDFSTVVWTTTILLFL